MTEYPKNWSLQKITKSPALFKKVSYTIDHAGFAKLFVVTDIDTPDYHLEHTFTDKDDRGLAGTEFSLSFLYRQNARQERSTSRKFATPALVGLRRQLKELLKILQSQASQARDIYWISFSRFLNRLKEYYGTSNRLSRSAPAPNPSASFLSMVLKLGY